MSSRSTTPAAATSSFEARPTLTKKRFLLRSTGCCALITLIYTANGDISGLARVSGVETALSRVASRYANRRWREHWHRRPAGVSGRWADTPGGRPPGGGIGGRPGLGGGVGGRPDLGGGVGGRPGLGGGVGGR